MISAAAAAGAPHCSAGRPSQSVSRERRKIMRSKLSSAPTAPGRGGAPSTALKRDARPREIAAPAGRATDDETGARRRGRSSMTMRIGASRSARRSMRRKRRSSRSRDSAASTAVRSRLSLAASAGSSSTRLTASAKATRSSTSTKIAQGSPSTSGHLSEPSVHWRRREAPVCAASTGASPKVSAALGKTKQSSAARNTPTFSDASSPRKCTRASTPGVVARQTSRDAAVLPLAGESEMGA